MKRFEEGRARFVIYWFFDATGVLLYVNENRVEHGTLNSTPLKKQSWIFNFKNTIFNCILIS